MTVPPADRGNAPQPRTMSSVAHELKLTLDEVQDHLEALAQDRQGGPTRTSAGTGALPELRLYLWQGQDDQASKCPECKGTRLYEPLVQIKP
jgi:hypothetical protein